MWKCPICGREFKNTNQNHSCQGAAKPTTIDAYIAQQRPEIQPLLEQVRVTIRTAAPDATEKISWQMPTFWQGENLIHFAASQKHLGIYPGDLSFAPFTDRLTGLHTTKGAIQFPYDAPIDFDLIADITRWRLKSVTEKG
ncbi:MAG: DUF1801 domain-containing protein [Oscillospiraceae bacterium]|nr:DUF1801 domain-containing protein [Oscillospiraceae bacterium]